MGIDYGSKKVGIAISDEEGKLAFPFLVLINNQSLVTEVAHICENEKVEAVIIGESIDSSGNPNKIMGSINEFKSSLEKVVDLPIYFENEFMTSLHSDIPKTKDIFSARKSKKEKNNKDDSKAATLILQRFLDRENRR